MTGLRLIADDLTGALDSAARLLPLTGILPIFCGAVPDMPPAHFAFDAGTREAEGTEAAQIARGLTPVLARGNPAFRKLDSLLRGHVAVEIAASAPAFDHVVIAPAFPFQRRITRGGRQLSWADSSGWRDIGVDLAAELRALGCAVSARIPGQPAPVGISLWDAAIDADLDRIVAAGRAVPGRVLWCGTAGLAGALAGWRPVPVPVLPRPMLALIGSDQPVAKAQLAMLGERHLVITNAGEASKVADALSRDGAVAISLAMPSHTPRVDAAAHIARVFAEMLISLGQPVGASPVGTLVVSGGETLRGVTEALGAARLDLDGEVVPGVPTSLLCGGAWEGLRIVSKSGAFGDTGFLARLLG